MSAVSLITLSSCRCCLAEININDLRSLFKCGKICGQVTKLAEMLKYTTNLEIVEDDGLPGFICNKCVVHVSKAFAFKQQCIKSDVQLRNEKLAPDQSQSEDVVYLKTDESIEDDIPDEDGYTYQLVEQYEDEERIDEDDENEYDKDENVQIILKVLRKQDEMTCSDDSKGAIEQYNIQMSEEVPESMSENAVDHEVIQEEVFEYEIENETSNLAPKGESDEELNTIPKMVFRKYNKRNKKMPAPPYICDVCSKVLSNYSSFKYHMQLHSDKKPFLCSDCGESFKTRNAYDGHIITHNENAMHKCSICQKSYRQAASLRSHMYTHSGEKPFVCNICGKGMTQKSGFKKHLLIHTGEKPHHCNICNKDFRYSSNLIIHKRSHIGDRKHKCEVCLKKFVGVEQLKRHSLIHTGQKPFCCDVCKKCFNRKSALQVHQNTHSQDRKQKTTTSRIDVTAANSSKQNELIFGT